MSTDVGLFIDALYNDDDKPLLRSMSVFASVNGLIILQTVSDLSFLLESCFRVLNC